MLALPIHILTKYCELQAFFLGHTRFATSSGPSVRDTHPHRFSKSTRVSVCTCVCLCCTKVLMCIYVRVCVFWRENVHVCLHWHVCILVLMQVLWILRFTGKYLEMCTHRLVQEFRKLWWGEGYGQGGRGGLSCLSFRVSVQTFEWLFVCVFWRRCNLCWCSHLNSLWCPHYFLHSHIDPCGYPGFSSELYVTHNGDLDYMEELDSKVLRTHKELGI